MNTQKIIFKTIYTVFSILIFSIIVLTFLSVFGIPENFKIFVVETGSMEPAITTGSLAFVTPQREYQKGDIITFKTPIEKDEKKEYTVTHRINDIKTENGDLLLQTKGDANNAADTLWINQIHVLGKVVGHVPAIGYIIGFTKTQIGFVLLILIPSIIIAYHEILNINREFKIQARLKRFKREQYYI